MNLCRQPAGLAAEDQHDVLSLAYRRIPEHLLRFRREEIRLAQSRQLRFEFTPILPNAQIDVFPVIKSRTFDLLVVEREAERLDQVECCAGSETGAAGITGIPVDFGMDQYDVDCQTDQNYSDATDERSLEGYVHTAQVSCELFLRPTARGWS